MTFAEDTERLVGTVARSCVFTGGVNRSQLTGERSATKMVTRSSGILSANIILMYEPNKLHRAFS